MADEEKSQVASLEEAARRLRNALDLLAQLRDMIAPVDNTLVAQTKTPLTTAGLANGIETYEARIRAYKAKIEGQLSKSLPEV